MANVKFIADLDIPLADQTRTKADLYLPDDGEPHPVLLARTPYSKVLTSKELELLNPLRAARRGYAVVIQDCRGRFASEGEFTPFADETEDGAASIAWCARQPWSNGRVGMWGMSYYGATQLLAAVGGPPELVAIAPVMTPSRYDDGWFFEGGVLRLEFAQFWAAIVAAESARRRGGHGVRSIAAVMGALDALDRDTRRPFGADQDEIAPFYTDWIENTANPTWWDRWAIATRFQSIGVPALHVSAWHDIFLEGAIDNYVGMRRFARTDEARQAQRLVIGPGIHGSLAGGADSGGGALGGAAGVDLPSLHFEFFDRHLALRPSQRQSALDAGVLAHIINEGWQALGEWPPRSDVLAWYLDGQQPNSVRGSGTLSHAPPAATIAHNFLHDPSRPVPTCGGATLGAAPAGRFIQTEIEVREDVLVYTSPPLDEPLKVVGTVRAELDATSTASPFDLCVKLAEVDTSGRSTNVADGVRRTASPSGRSVVEVDVGSIGIVFRPGSRVRIQIAGSNFPRLERTESGPAIHSVFTGRSRVLLPIVKP